LRRASITWIKGKYGGFLCLNPCSIAERIDACLALPLPAPHSTHLASTPPSELHSPSPAQTRSAYAVHCSIPLNSLVNRLQACKCTPHCLDQPLFHLHPPSPLFTFMPSIPSTSNPPFPCPLPTSQNSQLCQLTGVSPAGLKMYAPLL
jgi:hypothetical protein